MPIPVTHPSQTPAVTPSHPSNAEPPIQCSECNTHFAITPGMATDGMACPECGGLRLFRSQPNPTQSDGTLRDMVDSDSQKDQGGNPLGEGTIMGSDGEKPSFKRDNFMHGKTSATKSVVPNTLDMEPYDALYHEAGLWDTLKGLAVPAAEVGGLAALNLIPGVGEAADAAALGDVAATGAGAADAAAGAADAGAAAESGGGGVLNAIKDKGLGMAQNKAIAPSAAGGAFAGKVAPSLMKGVLGIGGGDAAAGAMGGGGQGAGAMGPVGPTPAPNMFSYGSTDIPMLLTADFETALSVPSVDEQSDDPEHQDQKQFHDGDRGPSNMENPNLEDSGAMGEDNARSDSAGYQGFAENSPGIERMHMMMPLLMHYHNSPESGEGDPLIKALHETLEGENPGYLNHQDPDSETLMQQLVHQHKQPPHGVHAAIPGLSEPPMPAGGGLGQAGLTQAPATPAPVAVEPLGMQGNGMGACPQCGGAIGPDGSCPTCGQTAGSDMAPGPGAMAPGTQGPAQGQQGMMPPMMAAHFGMTHLTNHQGPVTPEQIAAVQQYLVDTHREQETPNVPLHPEQYSKEMAEIQQDPNVTPQIDPSQLQQSPPQMPPNPQGAMPVMDPSQAGGGGGQPMQPMSAVEPKEADANNAVRRCPYCDSATTTVDGAGDGSGEGATAYGHCHACDKTFDIVKSARALLADLVDMPNPVTHPMAEGPQMVWKDVSGQPLEEGKTYEIHSAAFSVPDTVRVTRVKGDQLEVKLADGFNAGIEPDFRISRKEAQLQDYQFVLVGSQDDNKSTDPNTMPGQAPEQVPPVETTDTGPADPHTSVASVHTANDSDNDWHCKSCLKKGNDFPLPASCPECGSSATVWNDDPDAQEEEHNHESSCRKCSSTMIDHEMLSADKTMHQCVRCGNAWETSDTFAGRESGVDLSWLRADDDDDFHADMERHQAMASAAGSQSRDLASIAAKDERLQAIKNTLDSKAQQRTAGKNFSPTEKRALIDEYGVARNLGDLDLEGTHYDTRWDHSGKANGDNVDPAHLALGV